MTRSLRASFAAASTFLVIGCGCAAAIDFAQVTLTPSSVEAVRTASVCNVADPPYGASDVFTLTVVGKNGVPPPFTTLTLSLHDTTAAPSTPIPLNVPMSSSEAPQATQTASSTNDDITVSFARGSDATEIDDSFLSSVIVTVLAVPAADGDELSANLDLQFTDGSELHQTFSAKVTTTGPTCGTGR